MVYTYNEMVLSFKERNSDPYYDMGETWGHKLSKPVTKRVDTRWSTYEGDRKVKLIEAESRKVIARCWDKSVAI